MKPTWEFWNTKELSEELRSLSQTDRLKLMDMMNLFIQGVKAHPVMVQSYGEDLFCLRHTSGAYKGRCLFFTIENGNPVALLVYQKQSQKADPRAIETAFNRMDEYRRRKR